MDRLTRRIKSGKADCAYCNYEYEGDDNHCSPSCSVRNAQMEKLARYEDAEEQGLLIKLPCKLGDTVYVIGVDSEHRLKIFTVFLTREAAEAALEE